MKYLPLKGQSMPINWKKRARTVLIAYGIACLLCPALLLNTIGFVKAISISYINNTKYSYIKATKGDTMYQLYRAKENWKQAIKGMNPKTWLR